MSILRYLIEMPHGVVSNLSIDFKLEKPNWNKRLIDLITSIENTDILLKPFYNMKYLQMLKKKFLELSQQDQDELRNVLPDKFKQDVGI